MASISFLSFDDDAAWAALASEIDLRSRHQAVANVLARLRASGCLSAIVEDEYLDRDYSQEFSHFYSRQFRRYRRRSKRIHFFTLSSDELSGGQNSKSLALLLERASDELGYLGFLVVRPVEEAPIGRSVLRLPRTDGLADRVQVRATYTTHVLGASLTVRGMPFIQQDARLSACAQASIWMSGRHFHARHGGPWFSAVEITEAASNPTDQHLAQSLPAGANFLTADNMVRALTAMGRHPYLYAASAIKPDQWQWPAQIEPHAVLARYADSGIPVILILRHWEPGQSVGHAVVIVGTTWEPHDNLNAGTLRPTAAEFIPYFLVHDDQRGMYLRLPVDSGQPLAETDYNIREHAIAILVPLPDKVFINAEAAERFAWGFLPAYAAEWPNIKSNFGANLGDSIALGDSFVNEISANKIIARTYLTFGWKYKKRILDNIVPIQMKSIVSEHELPRLIWVTEFSRYDDINQSDLRNRRIIAHAVIDATSSQISLCALVFHAPGYLATWTQNAPTFYPNIAMTPYAITGDVPYLPRIRAP